MSISSPETSLCHYSGVPKRSLSPSPFPQLNSHYGPYPISLIDNYPIKHNVVVVAVVVNYDREETSCDLELLLGEVKGCSSVQINLNF